MTSRNQAAASSPTAAPGPAAAAFGLREVQPAVVTIDLHRGHLDPAVATMPLPAQRAAAVVRTNLRFLAAARLLGIPVVHMVTGYRDRDEVMANPFWNAIAGTSATRGQSAKHNLEGSPGVELMPGVLDPATDRVLRTKKRYDCFLATDLDFVLRAMGANLLLVTGVNTNSCVLATAIAASTRDFACVVMSDCVDSMDGPEFHRAALRLIERAFGWVMPWRKALDAVAAQPRPDQVRLGGLRPPPARRRA